MSFLYPLGLLGLIGVPILIIIYIIKNKYTEQTVSSTYLWTLSERFLKRKNPINKLAGIISLILQILAVVLLSLGIAHPVFTMPGMAERYTFVLDCSGSMQIENNGESRFDQAKSRIADIVNGSVDGSAFNLVCAGDVTTIYEQTSDKDRVLSLLDQAQPAYTQTDMTDALNYAQELFGQNTSTVTLLFTDKDYQSHNNVEVINVSAGENNSAIYNVSYTMNESGGESSMTVSANVTSYESDADLTVTLSVVSGGQTSEQTVNVTAPRLETQQATFEVSNISRFDSFTVRINEQDALALDNSVTVYSVDAANTYTTLLVLGETDEDDSVGGGFYLQSLLQSTGILEVEVLTEEEYRQEYMREGSAPVAPSGYGLYIFNQFNPEILPGDGTVWLVGLESVPSDAGYSVQGAQTLEYASTLDYSTSTSSVVRQLMSNLVMGDMYIKTYIKCSPYRSYTTLMSYNGNPVVFTTQTDYGNREVVMSLSLSDTDLPLRIDFIMLISNLIDYSFPAAVEETLYTSGQTATVNVVSGAQSIRVESPSGIINYLDTSTAQAQWNLTEVGIYTVAIDFGNDNIRNYYIYSSFPAEESNTNVTGASFALEGTQTYDGYDGTYDPLLILVILLAVIFLADWVVYCYEQFQLR